MIVECYRCEAKVDGRLVAEHEAFDQEDDPAPFTTYLLECPQCRNTLVAGQYVFEDDLTRLWPKPQKFLPHEIPEEIRNSLDEASKCFNATAYNATTVMAGRALEGVCRYFGSAKSNLGAGIRELLEKGVIDQRLGTWAAELQRARNLSAHASGDRVTKQDAEDLLQFLNAICEYVFVLTKRFEQFMQRKAEVAGGAPASRAQLSASVPSADTPAEEDDE